MSRLATSYLGLELRSPLVASASPYTRQPDSALRLQESGAAAIVLPSLFEEELVHEEVELSQVLEQGAGSFAESLDYFPAIDTFQSTADRYLTTIAAMKETLDVPVIASLNGTSSGGWVRYAKLIEEAAPTPWSSTSTGSPQIPPAVARRWRRATSRWSGRCEPRPASPWP